MDAVTVRPKQRGGLRAERRALTVEQAEGLLGAARDLADGPAVAARRRDQRTELRDGLIVLLLAAVGPRVSELTAANAEDFFVNGGTRYWRIFGKGGRTRDVPLPRPVVEVLDAYLADGRRLLDRGREPKALLLSWRGRRLARGDVQGVIDRVLARVEPVRRRSVTPHGLRHTTATHLLATATDMDAVRRVLGHADLSTLGRYRDELPGELEAAMRVHPLLGPVEGRRGG
jgi:site-specific recombinase XerD